MSSPMRRVAFAADFAYRHVQVLNEAPHVANQFIAGQHATLLIVNLEHEYCNALTHHLVALVWSMDVCRIHCSSLVTATWTAVLAGRRARSVPRAG